MSHHQNPNLARAEKLLEINATLLGAIDGCGTETALALLVASAQLVAVAIDLQLASTLGEVS